MSVYAVINDAGLVVKAFPKSREAYDTALVYAYGKSALTNKTHKVTELKNTSVTRLKQVINIFQKQN